MKIWLQFVLIEEYFLDFLFGVRLAFKGRFRSILAMIRDQSCLNMIAFESNAWGSQKTNIGMHGNALEFAPKFLNLFTIQSKVEFTKEEHRFL